MGFGAPDERLDQCQSAPTGENGRRTLRGCSSFPPLLPVRIVQRAQEPYESGPPLVWGVSITNSRHPCAILSTNWYVAEVRGPTPLRDILHFCWLPILVSVLASIPGECLRVVSSSEVSRAALRWAVFRNVFRREGLGIRSVHVATNGGYHATNGRMG